MFENKHERELSLIAKCMKVDYDGTEMNGEEAFKKLVIEHDILGKSYIIDYEETPVKITIIK